MFFALTGRPPFQAKSIGQLLAAHRQTPPPRLTDFCLNAPTELAAIVARCLSKDPADRFLAATADVYELTLVTADERLLRGKGYRTLSSR